MIIQQFCQGFAHILFLMIFLLVPTLSLADDVVEYTGEPRFKIVSDGNAVKPLEVNILIKDTNVTVSYLVGNNSSRNSNVDVIFDIPPVVWRGGGNWYPNRSYSEVMLYINDKNVEYARNIKAVLNKFDITNLLLQYELKRNDVGDMDKWTDNMTPEIAHKYLTLQKLGVLTESDNYPFPKWEAHNKYSYKFMLKAKENVTIKYTYTRLPGEFYFNKEDQNGLVLLAKAGLDWDEMRQRYDGGKDKDDFYRAKYMNLPLWPSDWKDGIPVVDISLQPGRDTDGKNYLVSLSLAGHNCVDKESLKRRVKDFKQDSPLFLQVKPLFNSKEMDSN